MTTIESQWPAFLSPEVEADPHAFYKRLRSEDPVHWDEGLGAFLISRHADVASAYRDPAFSTRNYEFQLEPVFGRSLLQMNGVEHTRKRTLVSPQFRGSGLERWMPVIARDLNDILNGSVVSATTRLVNGFEAGTTVDLLTDLGYFLPIYVITDMLGLPHSDYDLLFGWYTAQIDFLSNYKRDPVIDEIGRNSRVEFWDYLQPFIAERRRNPGYDLISALVTAEIEGEMLDDIEISTHVTQLLNAGSETTGKALASLFTHLLSDRRQFELVRDDRSKLLPAISETLRLSPPSQMNGRQVTEAVEVEGVSIPEDSQVILLIASANRDERRFAHPDDFDPARTDLAHEKTFVAAGEQFAFGGGRHFCLGAMLARSELEQASNVLLDRFPSMDFAAGERPQWKGLKMRSVEALHVTL